MWPNRKIFFGNKRLVMIISSAPLRISYLGGGTDYHLYYKEFGSIVIGSAINKRVYVFLNELSKVATENIRFTYRKIESVASPSDLSHPVVREAIKLYAPNERLNIATFADLPGRSGLGSSSAFTVALLNGIQHFLGNAQESKNSLAEGAVNLERNILCEIGGIQDQYHATFGNLRSYQFSKFENLISQPFYSESLLEELSAYHYLVYVGSDRDSNAFAIQTTHTIMEKNTIKYFHEMKKLAEEGSLALPKMDSAAKIIERMSDLINESWILKKYFGKDVSNSRVEAIIKDGLTNGASAGKLCGAGNSGYILFLVSESNREKFERKFQNELTLKISLSPQGISTIIH
jgi:D-glycero-alpha-D-manno-heptose-7-phosphate kinase